MSNPTQPRNTTWLAFRKALSAYYGAPVSSQWMSQAFKTYTSGDRSSLPKELVEALDKALSK